MYLTSSRKVRPIAFSELGKEDLYDTVNFTMSQPLRLFEARSTLLVEPQSFPRFSRALHCQTWCYASAPQRLQLPITCVRNRAHPHDQGMASPETPGWCQAVKKWNHRTRENECPAVYTSPVSKCTSAAPGREQQTPESPSLSFMESTAHGSGMEQGAEHCLTGKSLLCLLYLCNKLSKSWCLFLCSWFCPTVQRLLLQHFLQPISSSSSSCPRSYQVHGSKSFTLTSQKPNFRIWPQSFVSFQDF